jgi:hypothetical protein
MSELSMIGADNYKYRRLGLADLSQLAQLQEQSLRSNLDPSDRSSSFLSAAVPDDTIKEMDKSVAVIVCVEESTLLGFLCASGIEYCKSMDLPGKMISRLDEVKFHGKNISSLEGFVAGPICVEKERRGQGIFAGLYECLFVTTKDKFDFCVSLIDVTNEPSLRAHQKIGYEIVDMFSYEGEEFYTVALALHRLFHQSKRPQP